MPNNGLPQNHTALICEFEANFDVETWKRGDIHIWPIIRIALMTEWLNSARDLRRSTSSNSWVRPPILIYARLKVMVHALPSLISLFSAGLKSIRLAQGRVGIFTNDISRERAGGSFYQRFFDTLVDLQLVDPAKSINFEHVSHGKYPPYRPRINITGAELLAMLFALVLNRLGFLSLSRSIPFVEIHEWCAARGLPCRSASSRSISCSYAAILILSRLYICVIHVFGLTSVIKVCWYGLDGMALALACRMARIPCIDLQHGLAGAGHHRAYCNWTKFPSAGYELMPSTFWCWSKLDEQSIRSCFDPHRIYVDTRVTGNLWASLAKRRGQSLWYQNLFCLDGVVQNWAGNGSNIILVSLQGKSLPSIICEALMLSPLNWNWAIRVHPKYATSLSVLRALEEAVQDYSNVDVKCSSASSLYPLLSVATAHVTEWSAVYYDAFCVGLKTVFVSPKSLQIFSGEIDSGNALYADQPEQLIWALHHIVANRVSA